MARNLFTDFFNSEKAGGFVLIFCTAISILVANSIFGDGYVSFWETNVNGHSITHWINDGLMAIFFLLIGLELEREVYIGELSSIKKASLPVIAAIGGVVVPAAIYLSMNYGTDAQAGAGIPMATDIAFAVGILSLCGKRVPVSLKIFLTALAVIDDLCAILVIAIFYSTGIAFDYLLWAGIIFVVMLVLNRLKVRNLIPYLVLGVALWYCMLHSGVHATIAGVLTAFAIPFGNGDEKSTSFILQHFLHKPVAFIILPLFALANTCIIFEAGWMDGLLTTAGIGIFIGLVVGKPIGIMAFSMAAVAMKISRLPSALKWKHIAGAGMLGGIGFTMSIFITLLAFDNTHQVAVAKMAIIFASLTAAVIGLVWLFFVLRKRKSGI